MGNTNQLVDISHLTEKAKKIRGRVLNTALNVKDGHIAPAYSCLDILVILYEKIIEPEDKFILSKGHGCLGFYEILKDKGFKPTYSGHPDLDEKQGIFCTTGSLGHGLSIGVGMALARKLVRKRGWIYVLIGDGECQEGMVWESMNLAKKFKLDNLVVIVDNNNLQALDSIQNILDETNLREKFDSFGGFTLEIDGHNFNELSLALNPEKIAKDKPKIIIAKTIKGKGLSFMENNPSWHSRLPNEEQIKTAFEELS